MRCTGATRASREQGRPASARIVTALRVLIAKEDKTPSSSTAYGKKVIPWSLQFFSCLENLVLSNLSDVPGVSAILERKDNCSGRVTVSLKEAGRPAIQEGTKSLTGLNRSPGMIFRSSLMATKEAAVAALKIVSLNLS